jgi:hypothetical protein
MYSCDMGQNGVSHGIESAELAWAAFCRGQRSDVLHSAGLVAQLRRFKLLGTLPKPVQKAALKSLLAAL